MPIVSPHLLDLLVDGRQSERAMLVRRGVQRLMGASRVSLLPELSLDSGRRADLVGLTEKGDVVIVEIKSSIEDFRVDRKWPIYRLHCDRLYFATHPGVPAEIFPEDCGLILSDGYGAEILREAPEHRLPAPTRKAMTLRFARAAADRLQVAEWAANPYLTGLNDTAPR
ncbi:MmcB family DNA repair protein [Aureimonas psammosilenae]|uniref:MmcB family DNA repair protein n=1 Tax=Aureimonas psammosilenae TaxID=2495496 RepID=UPI0012606058|nr:MmcB family DNA repair protein [Aureimonas psammosilenae]